jgi:succinate dehydrogenase/fumarate reductase cytochrome b subunit
MKAKSCRIYKTSGGVYAKRLHGISLINTQKFMAQPFLPRKTITTLSTKTQMKSLRTMKIMGRS